MIPLLLFTNFIMTNLKKDIIQLELDVKWVKQDYFKFTWAWIVFITTNFKTSKEVKKLWIVVKKDNYYGYILEEFSCNWTLQEIEDLVDEFIKKYPLLHKRVYLS